MIVYLHVGAPKTGTTYLQQVLHKNRSALAQDGVCYPGLRVDHFRQAQDLMDWKFGGGGDPPNDGSWDATVAEIRQTGAPVNVISHEILSRADAEHVDRALDSLDFADVHVIYTARDLSRTIPAMWQEKIKNREQLAYDKFLRQLRRQYEAQQESGERFVWHLRDFDMVGTLQTWGRRLEPGRTHVVLTPSSGPPTHLWQRFAALLDVQPGAYDTDVERNPGLGQAEAEFLRRLNIALTDHDLTWPEYHRLVKHDLAQRVLAPGSQSPRVVLPLADRDWVRAWSEGQIAYLDRSGYEVIGELGEISQGPAADPAPVEMEQVAAAGALATAQLITRIAHAGRPRPPVPPVVTVPTPPGLWSRVRSSIVQRAEGHPRLSPVLSVLRRFRDRVRRR